jgi:hypothetical protein
MEITLEFLKEKADETLCKNIENPGIVPNVGERIYLFATAYEVIAREFIYSAEPKPLNLKISLQCKKVSTQPDVQFFNSIID